MGRERPRQTRHSGCRRRGSSRLLGSLCLLGLALGLSTSARAAEPKLLLLPFVVHSAEDPAYVRGGLSDMLSARFSRIGALELVREDDVAAATTRLDQALEAGRRAGADFVLFGSFTRFGRGASLDVQCAPTARGPAREPLREIFVHSGSIGDIIPDLDELAGKVSRFARGERVETSGGPAAVAGGAPRAAPSRELQDLSRRVADLEAAVSQLLDEGTDIEP